MTHWMCTNCGYYLQGSAPPERCPDCAQSCVFNDVTCYRPDCGGEHNLDPLLVGATLGKLTGAEVRPRQRTTPPLEAAPAVRIFQGLTDKQIERVRVLGKTEVYEPGQVICTEGTESTKLYLVEEGQVAVESEVSGQMRVPFAIVTEGQAFGWSSLVPPYRRTATDIALTKVRVLAIDREPLLALMRSDPALGLTVMQNVASIISSRLRNLELEMIGLVQGWR